VHHSVSGKDNVRIGKVARLRKNEVKFRETLLRKQPGQRRAPKGRNSKLPQRSRAWMRSALEGRHSPITSLISSAQHGAACDPMLATCSSTISAQSAGRPTCSRQVRPVADGEVDFNRSSSSDAAIFAESPRAQSRSCAQDRHRGRRTLRQTGRARPNKTNVVGVSSTSAAMRTTMNATKHRPHCRKSEPRPR
jgi:hypothetical protein